MSDPMVLLVDDPGLQDEILRAAHAAATAVVNGAPDELVATLLTELIGLHPNALLCALGHAHVLLRMAIDIGEDRRPGFRSKFMRAAGAALAVP